MSPQGAGEFEALPVADSASQRKVVEHAIVAVTWLGGFLDLLWRHRADGPELDLVPGAGSRLRDLTYELLADDAL